ncbi:hypothetical protein Tco_0233206 [Tanacetum coccineum]
MAVPVGSYRPTIASIRVVMVTDQQARTESFRNVNGWTDRDATLQKLRGISSSGLSSLRVALRIATYVDKLYLGRQFVMTGFNGGGGLVGEENHGVGIDHSLQCKELGADMVVWFNGVWTDMVIGVRNPKRRGCGDLEQMLRILNDLNLSLDCRDCWR